MRRNFIDEKMIEETKMLVNLFLETNASDIELSKMTGISSSTVGRRLTNESNILRAFPDKGSSIYELVKGKRQENLQRGKALGGQTSLLNHIYTKDASGKFTGSSKIRLDVVYPNEESQYRFLVHVALTFRLHLDTLSSLLGIDEDELLRKMNEVSPASYEALQFLFCSDIKNQDLAKERFIDYYRELLKAISSKDLKEKRRLINMVTDSKVSEFKKRWKPGDKISDEDLRTLLNYQLKYALTTNTLVYNFNINRPNYQRRVYNLIETEPELKQDYEYLSDFNSRFRKGRVGRYE